MRHGLAWSGLGLAIFVAALLLWRSHTGGEDPARPVDRDVPRTPATAPDATLQGSAPSVPIAAAAPQPFWAVTFVQAVVRGRVVDERRRPVADAVVTLRDEGSVVVTTRTDPEGTWTLAALVAFEPRQEKPWSGGIPWKVRWIHAQDARGRTAMTKVSIPLSGLGEDPYDVGSLVLHPAQALSVRVTADGAPLANAFVRVGGAPAGRSAPWRWITTASTGPDGLVSVTGLPAGTVSVLATARGHAPNVVATEIPREGDQPLDVALPEGRDVEVAVVEATSNTPIEGARVSLRFAAPAPDRGGATYRPAAGIPPTDGSGRTRVPVFTEGVRAWVSAQSDGRATTQRRESDVELVSDATLLTIELEAVSELSWPVIAGDGAIPADGTKVRIGESTLVMRRWITPDEGVIRDGRLVVPGARADTEYSDLTWVARLPDGRYAFPTIAQGETDGEEISFRASRTVRVRVLDDEWQPVVGVRAAVAGAGARFGSGADRRGENGERILEDLPPRPTRVRIYAIDEQVERQERLVDLTEADAEVEFGVPHAQTLHVQVVVNGENRLPPSWSLRVGEAYVPTRGAMEDAEEGVLTVVLRTTNELRGTKVLLKADGYGEGRGTIAVPFAGGEATVGISLDSRTTLEAAVVPPTDGRFELLLERFADEYGRWYATGGPLKPDAGSPTTFTLGPLNPGRYRLRERLTHLVSVEASVARGADPASLHLDLSAVGTVTGRVATPAGTDLSAVGIRVEGLIADDAAPPPVQRVGPEAVRFPGGARPVRANGTFQIRVPGDRDVSIEAWHPLLKSAGTVTVREARDEVVLTLVSAPTATFTLGPEVDDHRANFLVRRVRLWLGDGRGPSAYDIGPLTRDRQVAFGGFEAGTYTLWIDAVDFAPLLLREVALGDGETSLGTVTFSPGSTVHLDLRAPAGAKPPPLRLRAERIDEPSYVRANIVMGNRRPSLIGLGPGRFRLLVRSMGRGADAAAMLLDEEIELDGETDRTVVLDLAR